MRYLVLFGLLIGTAVHAQVQTPAPCVKPDPNNPECVRLLPQVDSHPVVIKDSTPIKVDLPQTPTVAPSNVVFLPPKSPIILPAPTSTPVAPPQQETPQQVVIIHQPKPAPSPLGCPQAPPGAGALWGLSHPCKR